MGFDLIHLFSVVSSKVSPQTLLKITAGSMAAPTSLHSTRLDGKHIIIHPTSSPAPQQHLRCIADLDGVQSEDDAPDTSYYQWVTFSLVQESADGGIPRPQGDIRYF